MIKVKRTKQEQLLVKNIIFLQTRSELKGIKLHRKFGVARHTFGAWVEGRANPTTIHLEKMSNSFKVSIDDLVRKDISKVSDLILRNKYNRIQLYLKANL